MITIELFTLSKLVPSKANACNTGQEERIAGLAQSIVACGLQQYLNDAP